MNSKFLLQVVVYTLLGAMVMADPAVQRRLYADELAVRYTGVELRMDADGETEVVYPYNHHRKKNLLLKIRFRGESSFRSSHSDIGRALNSIAPVACKPLLRVNTVHLPPFYYLFLFRLTPF